MDGIVRGMSRIGTDSAGIYVPGPDSLKSQAGYAMRQHLSAWRRCRHATGNANPALAVAQVNQMVDLASEISAGRFDPFPFLPLTKAGTWPKNLRNVVLTRVEGEVVPDDRRTIAMCVQLVLSDAYADTRGLLEDSPVPCCKMMSIKFLPSRSTKPVFGLDGKPIEYPNKEVT